MKSENNLEELDMSFNEWRNVRTSGCRHYSKERIDYRK